MVKASDEPDHESVNEPQAARHDLTRLVERGFIVWSWIGLLGAYVSTSALFAGQLLVALREGYRVYEFTTYHSGTFVGIFAALATIVVGWLVFYRYSVAIFRTAILGTWSTSAKQDDIALLRWFRSAVLYLIFTWVLGLAAVFLPYVLQISLGFTR